MSYQAGTYELWCIAATEGDRSIGRGTAAQRESPPAVLCGNQALLSLLPTSAHSIGFCVIRVCISSSSSVLSGNITLQTAG